MEDPNKGPRRLGRGLKGVKQVAGKGSSCCKAASMPSLAVHPRFRRFGLRSSGSSRCAFCATRRCTSTWSLGSIASKWSCSHRTPFSTLFSSIRMASKSASSEERAGLRSLGADSPGPGL